MITLNLTAKDNAEQKIKEYLEQNASETLANKINNGVQIQKDNLTLLNKKDLTGFMQYASDEARKQTEKGASFTCVDSQTVFGWAVITLKKTALKASCLTLTARNISRQSKKNRKQRCRKRWNKNRKTNKQVSLTYLAMM